MMRPKVDRLYAGYVFDLDGTIFLGDALLPTVGATLDRLRTLGRQVVFLSNNPTHTRAEYEVWLRRLGLTVSQDEIIHSSLIMVNYLRRRMPGARLFVVGEAPLIAELTAAGFEMCAEPGRVDAVIASFDRTFTYHKLQGAFDAIRAGAHFFATNGDRYCPVPGGGQPDAAAIIAAIEACTTKKVEAIVGKPSPHASEALLDRLQLPPEACVMTGDRLETDVAMGLNAGMAAALVLTGATDAATAASSPIRPTYVLQQLSDLLPPDAGA